MAETDQGPPDAPAAASYEFTPSQDETIRSLASAMQWVAIPLIIVGIFYAIAAVWQLVSTFGNWRALFPVLFIALAAAIYLTLGIWTRQAAQSFTSVVSTSGRDIAHLMDALDTLRKKYSLLALFVKIYIAILILALILGIVGLIVGGVGGLGS